MGVPDAAIDHANPDRASEGADLGLDLLGEFTCWCQNQCAWLSGISTIDASHERDSVREGLSGSGGRVTADITPGQPVGQGGGLEIALPALMIVS